MKILTVPFSKEGKDKNFKALGKVRTSHFSEIWERDQFANKNYKGELIGILITGCSLSISSDTRRDRETESVSGYSTT